ncbi:MAG TPA: LPS export ABC transporter periplasmic protein LptC [Methylomirabilota bacterium]|nr:LPS export ABC transporter periplasmic protein LptC [Methylomirabilota bacterium]
MATTTGHAYRPIADRPTGAERRAAFASAARHSRLVRTLRVALPTAGLLILLGVAAIGILTRIEIGLTIGDIRISAEGLSMDAPKLSGSDGRGRTFQVTADRAVQDLRDPRIIRLYDIVATVRQPDGQTAEFQAASGVYDAGGQSLALSEQITIRASDGSSANLQHAEIDLVSGDVTSDAPVSFSSSLGAIEAQGMGVGEKGGSVTFEGGVRMTVDPNAIRDGGGSILRGDDRETEQ